MRKYGNPPVDLGPIDLSPVEMMAWLYCPIKEPGGVVVLPPNLEQFRPIVDRVFLDCMGLRDKNSFGHWTPGWVYITAKTLWVTPEAPGNRPGWHCDGFMTDDLNYVWSDTNGTLFCEPEELTEFTQDHRASLAEMTAFAESMPHRQRTYPDKHLLRLDETVLHRVADVHKEGMRSFVKVSVSRHEYRLAGNSINHGLSTDWEFVPRQADRNSPEVTA